MNQCPHCKTHDHPPGAVCKAYSAVCKAYIEWLKKQQEPNCNYIINDGYGLSRVPSAKKETAEDILRDLLETATFTTDTMDRIRAVLGDEN